MEMQGTGIWDSLRQACLRHMSQAALRHMETRLYFGCYTHACTTWQVILRLSLTTLCMCTYSTAHLKNTLVYSVVAITHIPMPAGVLGYTTYTNTSTAVSILYVYVIPVLTCLVLKTCRHLHVCVFFKFGMDGTYCMCPFNFLSIHIVLEGLYL